jgi:hypothetical protein
MSKQALEQQDTAANKIETAIQSSGTDASKNLLDEANASAKPFAADTQSRQAIDDRLVVDNTMWSSAREIFAPDALAGLFPDGQVSKDNLQKVADSADVTPLQSLTAQAVLDAQARGAFKDVTWNSDLAFELGQMDVANSALEMTTAISADRFKELANGDDALSASEITTALTTVTDAKEKQALTDLLRNIDPLSDRNPFQLVTGGEQYVKYDSLQSKVKNDYADETAAITAMKAQSMVRLEAQGVQTDEVAPPPPKDVPDTSAPTDTTTTEVTTPQVGNTTYSVQKGQGFDRIARDVFFKQFGALPSNQQEYQLSNYIAQLNNNDRKYSGGMLQIDQKIQVPDLSGPDGAAFMQSLGAAS